MYSRLDNIALLTLILLASSPVLADEPEYYGFEEIEVIVEQGVARPPVAEPTCYERTMEDVENARKEGREVSPQVYQAAFTDLLRCQTPCLSTRDARFLAQCDLNSIEGCPDDAIEDAIELGYFQNLSWDRTKGLSCNDSNVSIEMPEIPSQVRREARQVHPICATQDWTLDRGGYWEGPQGDRIFIGPYSRESFCDLIHHRFGWTIEAHTIHLRNLTTRGFGGGLGISFAKLGEIQSFTSSRDVSLIEAEARIGFVENAPVTVGAAVSLSALYLARLNGRNSPGRTRCSWVAGGGGGLEYLHLNRNTGESQSYARATTGLLCHTLGEVRRNSFLVSGVFDVGVGFATEQETGTSLSSPRGVARVRSGATARIAIGDRLWVSNTVLRTHEFWRNESDLEHGTIDRERPYWIVDIDVRLHLGGAAPERTLARRPYLVYQFDWANDSGSNPTLRPSTPSIVNQIGVGLRF